MAAGCSFFIACRKKDRTAILLEDESSDSYPATAEKP
jgi:hypothetical protein